MDLLYPLRRLHGLMVEGPGIYRMRKQYRQQIEEQFQANPRSAFFLMTPHHGNLGDQAIAMATEKMAEECGIHLIEVPIPWLYDLIRRECLSVLNGYPIFIQGGGNLGTLWPDVEELQRQIVRKNPCSSIMILPNTCFYEDSPQGKAEFARSCRIYNSHKKLTFYAREKTSFAFMSGAYRCVKLAPDMVLSLGGMGQDRQRQGCILCLRSDCEKTRTPEQEKVIREQAQQIFSVRDSDMVVGRRISSEQREREVMDKMEDFSSAELVITDRLHGMIFCAVTGTPCIVINSKSPKVRGCYQWICDLPYIRFLEEGETVAQAWEKIPRKKFVWSNAALLPGYEELKRDMDAAVRRE